MPLSFRSIYSGSQGRQLGPIHPQSGLCFLTSSAEPGCEGGDWRMAEQPQGVCREHSFPGGLVAFVLSLSSSAASVTRITSHVSALKFADWEPHGAHQVPVISTQLALYFVPQQPFMPRTLTGLLHACHT